MEAVFDNFDLDLEGFGYTLCALPRRPASSRWSWARSWSRCGSARSPCCAGPRPTYVTLVRNTPLLIVLLLLLRRAEDRHQRSTSRHRRPHRRVRIHQRSSRAAVVGADALHLGLRLRGAPLGRQRRAARPGRGRPRDRAAVRRRDEPGRAAPGLPRVAAAAGQRADRAAQEHPVAAVVRRRRGDRAGCAAASTTTPRPRVGDLHRASRSVYVVIVEVLSLRRARPRAALEGRPMSRASSSTPPGRAPSGPAPPLHASSPGRRCSGCSRSSFCGSTTSGQFDVRQVGAVRHPRLHRGAPRRRAAETLQDGVARDHRRGRASALVLGVGKLSDHAWSGGRLVVVEFFRAVPGAAADDLHLLSPTASRATVRLVLGGGDRADALQRRGARRGVPRRHQRRAEGAGRGGVRDRDAQERR